MMLFVLYVLGMYLLGQILGFVTTPQVRADQTWFEKHFAGNYML